jgi:threonine/homoserine/homoserine lactone efflux protein
MHLEYFLKGLAIGFAIAAPVGPIGVLCIRRTLAEGRFIGFLSGLGAATADMSYGAVAAFGLTAVKDALINQQFWLHVVGGFFLLYLGIRTFLSKPAEKSALSPSARGRASAYFSTLGLTLTNPATIISFAFIFAGFQLAGASVSYGSAALIVLGVFLGSAAWWLTLSGIVGFLRDKFSQSWMLWVNRIAGVVIFAFGIATFLLK